MSAVDSITEAALIFGWLPDYCLAMPARRFFAMLDSGRRMEMQRKAADHVALCDISSISISDVKYFNEVRTVFKDRALGFKPNQPRPAMDPTDPKTIELLSDLTLQASKFH